MEYAAADKSILKALLAGAEKPQPTDGQKSADLTWYALALEQYKQATAADGDAASPQLEQVWLVATDDDDRRCYKVLRHILACRPTPRPQPQSDFQIHLSALRSPLVK